MKYSDIPFIKNSRRFGSRLGLFKGRNWLHKFLFDRLVRTAPAVIASKGHTDDIDTETLYANSERWRDLKFGTRQAYGRAAMYLLEHDLLPLRESNKGKGGKRRFKRMN